MLKVLELGFRGDFWVLARNMFDRDLRILGQLDQVVAKWDGLSFVYNDIVGDFVDLSFFQTFLRLCDVSSPGVCEEDTTTVGAVN